MTTVFLALGSNVGNSTEFISNAVSNLSMTLQDIQRAPLYSSKAVGYTKQADFLNTAIRAQTDLSPIELFKLIKKIEKKTGRTRRFRWGPREIDIDLIFYGNLVMDTEQLTIPHPRFTERDFVLQPMIDIQPNIIDPLSKISLKKLLASLPDRDKSILKRIDK